MFRAGVPEKIIQEHTGHRSLKALRAYQRTTAAQHLAVAKVLSASSSDVRFSDTNDKPGPSSNVCGIPGFATMIGTASHCVINVNMGQPSVTHTEKHWEEHQETSTSSNE